MAEVAQGTLVDGRYLIGDRIGSGGMADVYRAEDRQLGREVALKMLHRRFARDREFVERFRREASAAAKLQHPNVVSVFDRGEHDGTYYIAMERLGGRTLKELIRAEAPLEQVRAIDLATQILQAAGFAHRHGVVHRDFKPHNVIVGPDDRLKVTDFGIARAGASEMTETGSIMGTAQYLSPEQAQGQRVGAPSDLYSIGVIIYEMLTGRVPFDGDSAVAIALKHVGETPPPLHTLRPDIHPALEAVVARALAKDPAERFATAEQFLAALESARATILSDGNGQGTGVFVPPPAAARRRWPWIALAVLALALAGGALAWKLTHPPQRVVPAVVGDRLGPAQAALSRAGFKSVVHRSKDPQPAGVVIAEQPRAGQKADKGSAVRLEVSNGPGQIPVPQVSGLVTREAMRVLSQTGLRPRLARAPSDAVPRGTAIGTQPPNGTPVDVGAAVKLVISSGPPLVPVPSVIGRSRPDATAALAQSGLGFTVVTAQSSSPAGQVFAQDPIAGTQVSRGSRVTITVSSGEPQVAVPDVTGQDHGAARGALTKAGFKVKEVSRPSAGDQPGTVIDESPAGGAKQAKGSTVTITVATTPPGGNGPGGSGGTAAPQTGTGQGGSTAPTGGGSGGR